MRLLVLDQVGFQRESFCLAIGHDEFDLTDLTHHQANARAQIVATAEIAAHPAAQTLGFAHVKQTILSVTHQVATRFGRDVLQPTFQAIRLLEQGGHAENLVMPVCIGSGQLPLRLLR